MSHSSREPDARAHTAASSLPLTVGFGLVGVSAFALMAAGPRVLGEDGYSALALTWTIVTIIGVGVATPGEQVITRSVASSSGPGTVRAVRRRLLLLTPLTLFAVPLLLEEGKGVSHAAVWAVTILLSSAGWAGSALTRGLLAGRQLFRQYAAVLVLEAMVRLALVVMAVLLPKWGLWVLAAAVAMPLIASALLGWRWVRTDQSLKEAPRPASSRPEQASMTTVALLIQVCLSTAPLWLSQQSVDAALSGAFVTVTAYMRSPVMLAGGLMAPLLTAAAKAYAQRQRREVAVKTLEALVLGAGGSALLVAVLLAFNGLAMTILYGGQTGLPISTFVWLGASTIAFIAANVLTNSLYGCQHARTAALVWIAPALLSTLLFAVAQASPTWLAAASAIGQVLAGVLLAAALALVLPPRRPAVRTALS